MRPYHITKIVLASVAVMLSVTLPSLAQSRQRQGGQGQGQNQQSRVERMLERMGTQLELTDAQKKQLRPILEAQGKKMREIWQDENLSQEQKRAKMTALREQYNAQFKKVLTPEQYKKWEQAMQQRRGQRGQGRGQGQGGGRGQNQ